MVLGTFAETKVPRRAGAKPGIKINPKTILYSEMKCKKIENRKTLPPLPLLTKEREKSEHVSGRKRTYESKFF